MRFVRRRRPVVSVVVPTYDVAAFLPECLDSLLGQSYRDLEIVVVDDGSTDGSGAIADEHATHDARLHVVHTENRGLGAARNVGVRHVSGDYLAFLDSDDVLPSDAYAAMVARLETSGSDFVSASFVRWEDGELTEPPWMRRLHSPARVGIGADDHPEILGDVLAWDKLFRRSFWDAAGLDWPEGIRYEDQPTTTKAFLRGRFDVVPDVVYHWRIRTDGSSITQQRSSVQDLADRIETKRMSLAVVRAEGSTPVQEMFVDRVLAGDMWRYFTEIPGAPDDWWSLLRGGVQEFWGSRSLVHSGLPPVHRLTGWLVEQDRRSDAVAVMEYAARHDVGRVTDPTGHRRIDVPVIAMATIDPAATELRPHER
jgi:glycosyltransferase involved in cell wall biosynthesis